MDKVKSGSAVCGFLDPGKWSACFGMSYANMLLFDLNASGRLFQGGSSFLRMQCGSGGLVQCRNQVVTDFLDRTEGEWLFLVDTDMGFAPDALERLILSADRYHRPVMGALCFQLRRRREEGEFFGVRHSVNPTVYNWVVLPEEVGFVPIGDYARGQVIKVAGTGAAAMVVNRRSLNKIREADGDNWFTPIVHPTGYKGGPREFSEDLSFCVRLAQHGIPVHCDTSVRTTHDKGGVFLDEAEYDRFQLTESAVMARAAVQEHAGVLVAP